MADLADKVADVSLEDKKKKASNKLYPVSFD
jgi:hypothetical protein